MWTSLSSSRENEFSVSLLIFKCVFFLGSSLNSLLIPCLLRFCLNQKLYWILKKCFSTFFISKNDKLYWLILNSAFWDKSHLWYCIILLHIAEFNLFKLCLEVLHLCCDFGLHVVFFSCNDFWLILESGWCLLYRISWEAFFWFNF